MYIIISDPYLSLVSIQNQLGVDIKKNDVKQKILSRVTELGLNNSNYKNNQELLLLICNLVEFLLKKKDKISKKEMVLDILNTLFNLQPQEIQAYQSNIEFLHQSKMIKQVSKFKLFCVGIKELLFKKK